jgi:trehalose-phosphatase
MPDALRKINDSFLAALCFGMEGKIMVVSNTLPVHSVESTGEGIFAPSYSSMAATILYGMPEETRGRIVFVGLPAPQGMRRPETCPRNGYKFVPVEVERMTGEYSAHISNTCHASLIVPALSVANLSEPYNEYAEFNAKFADVIVEMYKPGDKVVVLGKDLWLLPGILRNRVVDCRICIVLTLPFPPHEVFACVPHAKDLLRSMIAADRIVFQTMDYLENFKESSFALIDAQYKEVSLEVLNELYGEPNRKMQAAGDGMGGEREKNTSGPEMPPYKSSGFLSLLSDSYMSKMKLENLNLGEVAKQMQPNPQIPRSHSEEKERLVSEYLEDCAEGGALEKGAEKKGTYIMYVGDLRTILSVNPFGLPKEFLGDVKRSSGYADVKKMIEQKYAGKKIVVIVETTRKTDDPIIRLQAAHMFLCQRPETNAVFIRMVVHGESFSVPNSKASGLSEKIAASFPGKLQTLIFPGLYEYIAILSIAEMCLPCSPADAVSPVLNEYLFANERTSLALVPYSAGITYPGLFYTYNCPYTLCDKIEKCLRLEVEELDRRRESNLSQLCSTQDWMEEVLAMMRGSAKEENPRRGTGVAICGSAPLDRDLVVKRYREAEKRILLLDYDGTLTEIVKNPRDAAPSEEILEILSGLASDRRNKVCIITGRKKEEAEEWFGKLSLTVYAEHGAYKKEDGKWEGSPCPLEWIPDAVKVIEDFAHMTPGTFIEVKNTCVVFHCGGKGQCCAETLNKIVGDRARVVTGKGIIEVRPKGVDKGECVLKEIEKGSFVLCCGDDVTDEDMFMILKEVENAFSVCIGKRDTCAGWRLPEPGDLRRLLKLMAKE